MSGRLYSQRPDLICQTRHRDIANCIVLLKHSKTPKYKANNYGAFLIPYFSSTQLVGNLRSTSMSTKQPQMMLLVHSMRQNDHKFSVCHN